LHKVWVSQRFDLIHTVLIQRRIFQFPSSSVCWFTRQRPKALRVGRPNKGELFFFFPLFLFSVNFEILGEIKNDQIRKFYFEKLLRLKLVQFEICSISNFMFNFEFHVQIRKYVQIQICSISNLFKFEFVQT
jgi:hypothetical protein